MRKGGGAGAGGRGSPVGPQGMAGGSSRGTAAACRTGRGGGAPALPVRTSGYGVVLVSENVSVLPYVPRSRVSEAPIDCWKPIVTRSLVTGPEYVSSCSGVFASGSAVNAGEGFAAFAARSF